MSDKCPHCGSTDLMVGNIPLSCNACGWSHLNKYPCDVCKQPSVSRRGCNGATMNRCKVHAPTEEEVSAFFAANIGRY